MRRIIITKNGKEIYRSPENDIFGLKINYENREYIKIEFDNLYNANLRHANLENANLENANLYNANLENASLYNANLRYASLENASLYNANLRYANLENANLYNANLENASLYNANLENASLDDKEKIRKGKIMKENVIVFKKCHERIVELELQIGSIVFSINNKKCRTNKVKVISIDGNNEEGTKISSNYDSDFIYEVGKMVEVEDFDLMYNVECSTGIHFFWTKEEAEKY